MDAREGGGVVMDGPTAGGPATDGPARKLRGTGATRADVARRPSLPPRSEQLLQHLAAIVEGSDDAILTKDLDGIITSWNRGAERLFGYTAAEAIGKPVTLLIPREREDEEPAILSRLRRGERIDHYETIRRHKDGGLLHISLTVSPLRDKDGMIFGASKIARDVTERHRAQSQQRLLLGEMQHRIKNAYALASGLVRICARQAETAAELAGMLQPRLHALAQAHALAVPDFSDDHQAGEKGRTTLHGLLWALCAPAVGEDRERLILQGDDLPLEGRGITPLALVLHELATNAAKYGAFSDVEGTVTVAAMARDGRLVITWSERTGRPVAPVPGSDGFGAHLSRMTIEEQLDGTIAREWTPDGLTITLDINRSRLG